MRGDFVIVLTFDKSTNEYFFEMYRYQIDHMIDKVLLFQSTGQIQISVELNEGRREASIFIEEFNFQSHQFMRHTVYLLSSADFRVASPSS